MAVSLEKLNREQHSRNSFQYQALEHRSTIRLLRLDAGRDEKITCSLHHFKLEDPNRPPYSAISYTWGKDAARHKIHLLNDTVLLVRRNLRNALRSIRDEESGCWLWIDAICINQASYDERNHQVKLMAEVYGRANKVIVWLPSAGERRGVATAFRFILNATSQNGVPDPVYSYARAYREGFIRDWRAVEDLCRLRYWTRKWIIQEVLTAHSVVLQANKSTLPMANLEAFCRQMQHYRNDGRGDMLSFNLDSVLTSPAARLALQRSQRRDASQPRYLYELVERYADNDCQEACDHIYALYSLADGHRTHFSIDYGATGMRQFVDLVHFAHTWENLPPAKVLEFAFLVLKLLRIRIDEFTREEALAGSLQLLLPATVLGMVELPEESKEATVMRRLVTSLNATPVFLLDTVYEIWLLTGCQGPSGAEYGREDMVYFRIANTDLQGLAACRLKEGDAVWHLPGTSLVLVVTQLPGNRTHIIGTAHLFSATGRADDPPQPWLERAFNYDDVRRGERNLSMSLAAIVRLGSLVMPTDTTEDVSRGWRKNRGSDVWRRHWHHLVIITGSTVIFTIVLAVVLIQTNR